MRWRSRGTFAVVVAEKSPEKSHICKDIPTGCCPGFFVQQWQWDFIGAHGFSILGPTRGYIGSLNLFWGQTSQAKLELWEVCVFVKWSTVNSRQDQMIRVTFIGNMLAAWSCWNDEVTPPRAEHMKSRRQQKEWNMKSRYRSAQVIWGFFCWTLFYQVPRGKLHFLLLHTRKTIFIPQILAHHEDSQTSAKRNNYYFLRQISEWESLSYRGFLGW